MAGALETLNAWLENKRRVAKRNLQDMFSSPEDFGKMAAFRTQQNMEESMSDPTSGLNYIGGPLGGLAGVIKVKGGNWLPGSVEKALSSLKRPLPVSLDDLRNYLAVARAEVPEEVARYERELATGTTNNALNKWVEGPLTKYVKTQMATPEDPVRALAEQGILHNAPQAIGARDIRLLNMDRVNEGFSQKAISPLARDWENLADLNISAKTPADYTSADLQVNPWISKLPENSRIYEAYNIWDGSNRGLIDDLGFGHLTDELRNALNPESGLPRQLLLRPEQMQQMGMEKAVRHVAAINDWRAAQKIAADRELANRAMVVREYAENNPKGLRWSELKLNPDMDRVAAEQELRRQLKYEGDTMGHCVGGYCPDVLEGRSRIFSLRDAKGEPHVTVEVQPNQQEISGNILNDIEPGIWDQIVNDNGHTNVRKWLAENRPDVIDRLNTPSIVQIKGKQNQAPNPEYLPFVQDFVKNSPIGQGWGDVGDLGNTGLMNVNNKYVTPNEFLNLARRHGIEDGSESPYAYYRRLKRYNDDMLSDTDRAFIKDVDEGNYAKGGIVENNSAEGGLITPHAMLNRVISAYNQL